MSQANRSGRPGVNAVTFWARFGEDEREFAFERHGDRLMVTTGGRTFALDASAVGDGGVFSLLVDGQSYDVVADIAREEVTVQLSGERYQVHVEDRRERAAHAVAGNKEGGRRELRAAMPGIVVEVKVAVGDTVEDGQTLVVLEAMKMQNPLAAEGAGKVTRIVVAAGEAVASGALLIELE